MPPITRRRFLHRIATRSATCSAAWYGLSFLGSDAEASPPVMDMQTYTYKNVAGHEIKADVYRPTRQPSRAAVVWIHGGALINGHRAGVSNRVKEWALGAGHALISIDYRLAPETQLPQIISDVEDALAWVRREGAQRFELDPGKIAVAGGSAGGYLTLTSGFRVQPPPAVLLSLWGYGDLVGPWYSKPSPHPRHHQVNLTQAEAQSQVSGPVISDSRQRKGDGGAFYQHCRQHGSWPQAVSGWNPLTEPEKFYPFMAVKNVTAKYPPCAMIHGTVDTDVPYELSEQMAAQFAKHKVPHKLLTIQNGEHGLAGADPTAVDAAYTQAFAFVDHYLQGNPS